MIAAAQIAVTPSARFARRVCHGDRRRRARGHGRRWRDVQDAVLDRRVDECLHSYARGAAHCVEEIELVRAVEAVDRF